MGALGGRFCLGREDSSTSVSLGNVANLQHACFVNAWFCANKGDCRRCRSVGLWVEDKATWILNALQGLCRIAMAVHAIPIKPAEAISNRSSCTILMS